MALTKKQLAERRKGIGGSDAAKICNGEWFALWQDKTGAVEPEDLSGVWPVQLGTVTEELNLDWYERKVGHKAERRGEAVILKDAPLRCTLDGFDVVDQTVIQAKHVNGFSKIDDVRARYSPQVMHEMICCGVKRGILSVIIGTNEPVLELIELDDFWAVDYIAKCKEFWGYVERKEPPPQGAPAVDVAPPPVVMRVVSMEGNNAFAAAAADWLKHRDGAKLFKASEVDIKAMIEADVREASGHGIKVSRNKAGSLSIKEN